MFCFGLHMEAQDEKEREGKSPEPRDLLRTVQMICAQKIGLANPDRPGAILVAGSRAGTNCGLVVVLCEYIPMGRGQLTLGAAYSNPALL